MTRRPAICPHCGRPYAPTLTVTGPIRNRIVETVANRPDGITLADLARAAYADDPDGGPMTALNSVQIIIRCANKQLASQGYQIKPKWLGRGAPYVLVPL